MVHAHLEVVEVTDSNRTVHADSYNERFVDAATTTAAEANAALATATAIHNQATAAAAAGAPGDAVLAAAAVAAAAALATATAADNAAASDRNLYLFKERLIQAGVDEDEADNMYNALSRTTPPGNGGATTRFGANVGAICTQIRLHLIDYRRTTNSNREMGHLFMSLVQRLAPNEFAKITDPNPLKWLRFAQYVASPIGADHIGGAQDTKYDIDTDYVASICGIEDRRHVAWDSAKTELDKVSIWQATCTLVHDTRRKYTGDLDSMAPHFVHNHGVMDIETISGAYFMSRAEWEKIDTPAKKKAVGMYAPVYVYTTNIKVPLLKYNNQYYPDLRTTGKIDGITKVGPDGDDLAVYANDLYGRIDSDDLIQLRNTVVNETTGVGRPSYHVRGGALDELKVPQSINAAAPLYYFGKRADMSHVSYRYQPNTTNKLRNLGDNSYNGTPKSIYQLGARFGIEHAHDSVLGCVLPMAIKDHTATYCAYCAPMSLPGAVLGPLEVDTRNPKGVMPTELELAEALSRKGRHNEVGIALQKLMPNKQGDLILFDGV